MCSSVGAAGRPVRLLLLFALFALVGCSSSGSDPEPQAQSPESNQDSVALSRLAQLGEKIFDDPNLSSSGQLSCASCHDKDHAFAGADGLAAPLGGALSADSGFRNTPALTYLQQTPAFQFDAEGTPTGGFNRDGRAKDFAEQAVRPFLTSFEMGNDSAAAVVEKLKHATYADEFRQFFGSESLDNPDSAFLDIREALQAFEQENPRFQSFTSKFDYFLAGKLKLTQQELRGLALFNNPTKGNCAACHPSTRGADGSAPLFTDFTYDNLGVPRNDDIPINQDPSYFDLGLCGPAREDLVDRKDLCGAFKVPSLRNASITAPYFHNGKFKTLREVVSFYVRRDTHPEEWYPLDMNGEPQKFNDVPAAYVGNVNTTEAPYNRKRGDEPALSSDEIDDVVAFLQTLTDGYIP
jgi:cytochrome c peroxidase